MNVFSCKANLKVKDVFLYYEENKGNLYGQDNKSRNPKGQVRSGAHECSEALT